MVAYFKSLDGSDSLYRSGGGYRYRREAAAAEGEEGGGGGGGGRSRSRGRKSGGGKRNKKSRRKQKRLYSDIGADFSYSNLYRDAYGGPQRNRHCQMRMFRVSFRDLGWEVRLSDKVDSFRCIVVDTRTG